MGENKSIIGFLRENLSNNPIIKVEVDFSGATWEVKESFKAFCGDTYEERINIARNAFINGFNKNSRDLSLSDRYGNERFFILVKVNNLSRRVSIMRLPPRIKLEVEGSLFVVDNRTHMAAKTMNFDLMGEEDLAPADRLAKTFDLLARKFLRS